MQKHTNRYSSVHDERTKGEGNGIKEGITYTRRGPAAVGIHLARAFPTWELWMPFLRGLI